MPTTKTSASMAASIPVKGVHIGNQSVYGAFTYTGATITASANALVVDMCKIPHGAYIHSIVEAHSSGADTCPVDIGIEVTSGIVSLSAFASQVTKAISNVVSPLKLPFLVSCPDTQSTQYAKIKLGVSPGTATSAIQLAITVNYSFDKLEGDKKY